MVGTYRLEETGSANAGTKGGVIDFNKKQVNRQGSKSDAKVHVETTKWRM